MLLADGLTAADVSVTLELPERYLLGVDPAVQLSTSDAMGGTMVNEIKDKGWLLFSNIVGANDTNMLSENYSGLVGMINKRINIVQTDYAEVAAKYLKSKGYR